MAKYKLQASGVLDTETGMNIPNSGGNRHWREYLSWLAEGNAPDPEFTDAEVRENRRREIKEATAARILNAVPEWKQRNMLAEMIEILDKQVSGDPVSADELASMEEARATWAQIKQWRLEADEQEAAL